MIKTVIAISIIVAALKAKWINYDKIISDVKYLYNEVKSLFSKKTNEDSL